MVKEEMEYWLTAMGGKRGVNLFSTKLGCRKVGVDSELWPCVRWGGEG